MIILPFLLLFIFSPSPISAKQPVTVNVGVILDLSTQIGLMSRTAINLAISDFYSSRPNTTTHLRLHTRDSNSDVVSAAAAAVDLIVNNHAHAIIGPQTSPEVAFVADLGIKSHVPILSFSATSSSVSPARSPFFVRTAPSDVAQAAAIAALVHAFNWRRVVLIYEDDDYGASLVPSLIDALSFADTVVPYRSAIPTAASDDQIAAELYRLTTLQTRVFILHATCTFAPRLLSRASAAGMMAEGFVWIATAALTSTLNSLDPTITGILTVKPYIPRSPELHDFRKRWRSQFPSSTDVPELNNIGIWAYDTVTAIARAAENITMESGFDTNRMQTNYSMKLSDIGVARSGQELLDSILATEFDGMGGRFRLVGGERNVTAFQIVNLLRETERVIGYWTAKHGLTRQLNSSSEMGYSASRTGLGAVIWPGEGMEVPRGWVEPVVGRTLRIAVPGPVEIGFHSFLNVDYDPVTNETVASGFVIDVFEAAVAELPYALIFEYAAYENGSGKSAGNYNQLVQQVYDENFDAVVGDVTITANRSKYVDFTLPYTESGVRMVVPVKDEKNKNGWIFLKPLSADLWAVSCAFFVFTGVVVWILEHQINEEFRGPPSHQIGTVFYFSFSTLVYAHRERLMNNLSRIVITIWVFVVLILQSSYVASLTSMLTVQRLQPTVTDLSELIRNKEHVGYLKDSFVHGLLLKKGFHESNLKPYESPRQYEAALRKGSSGGGVAAVVDEIPYLKVFLKDFCDNYTMTGLTYKTGGFGFVFPIGSPIVPDLSRAILSVTEGDKMVEIEKKWFGDQTICPNKENTISSNSLNAANFWGLFLITGIASFAALVYYLVSFLCKHRDALRKTELNSSAISRIRSIAQVFDEKDLCSHTFRKAEQKEGSMADTIVHTTPSHANGSESPFSISNHNYEGGSPLTFPTSPAVDVSCTEMSPTSARGSPLTMPTSPAVDVSWTEMSPTSG